MWLYRRVKESLLARFCAVLSDVCLGDWRPILGHKRAVTFRCAPGQCQVIGQVPVAGR
jgi:hypothetical protein